MGVTPIYHFDYTKFSFKFIAKHAMGYSPHNAVNHHKIILIFNSPLGSMTAARDSFTMLKTREKTLINNRPSGANNKQYRFHGSLFWVSL